MPLRMNRYACVVVVTMGVAAAACGSAPTAPSDTADAQILRGQTVSAADGQSTANVSIQVGREGAVTSDADGLFQVSVEDASGTDAVLSGASVVERRMIVAGVPGNRLRVSLIPSTFDLTAFDEMFRTTNSRLQRWTTRPRLAIVATVMDYRSTSDATFIATPEQLTDDEVSAMTTHLTEGLALLTGGTFTSFSSVDVERPAAGTRVSLMRPGAIVVGRFNGVMSLALTIGYGQWAEQSDGAIGAGAMVLDRDFDKTDGRRRLLRIHELGHALGYRHVTSRTSIMNPSVGPEPTDFDRVGAIIAFERQPGNRAPDTDPGAASASRSPFARVTGGAPVWAAPILCGHAASPSRF